MSNKSNEIKTKTLALELFLYGEFIIGKEPINPKNLREGFKEKMQFQSWGSKDNKPKTPKDLTRINEILPNFGLVVKQEEETTWTGRKIFSIEQSKEHPTIVWLMKIQEIVKTKPELLKMNFSQNTDRE